MPNDQEQDGKPRNEKPVSLHPLTLRDALKKAMDAGEPKDEQKASGKAKRKRADKRRRRG